MSEQYPSNLEMAKNLGMTAKDAFKLWIKKGALFADNETAKARMSACLECEFINEDCDRCTVCGCFLNTKVKIQASACPKYKWEV